MPGKFFTFEGPEGGGKSTHAAALAQQLRALGHSVKLTREPGGTWLGESVRNILKDHQPPAPTPVAELMLFLAARSQLVETVIRPALAAGVHVICDRFADSTTVYQGCGRHMDKTQLRDLNRLATGGLTPDMTFLLDLDVKAGLLRAQSRQSADGQGTDRIEREALEFHERVRQGYLALSRQEPDRFKVLDATRSSAELQQVIWKVVQHVIQS
ncbi:MAG: dTMP kinase [Kiritimatiellia bacterium]